MSASPAWMGNQSASGGFDPFTAFSTGVDPLVEQTLKGAGLWDANAVSYYGNGDLRVAYAQPLSKGDALNQLKQQILSSASGSSNPTRNMVNAANAITPEAFDQWVQQNNMSGMEFEQQLAAYKNSIAGMGQPGWTTEGDHFGDVTSKVILGGAIAGNLYGAGTAIGTAFAGAGSGAAAGGGAIGGEAGAGLTGGEAAGAAGAAGAGAGASSAIPEIVVTGTAGGGGGGALAGSLLGAGTAANTGIGILNSQGANINPTTGETGGGSSTGASADSGLPSLSAADPVGSSADALGSSSSGGGGLFGSNLNLADAKNIFNIGSSLYGLYTGYQQQQAGKSLLAGADPFGPYRAQYGQQLSQLMANPSSIISDPGYQFQFDQGQQALNRSMAAKGFLGSGNLATAATKYGQDYAQDYLLTKEQYLSGLAGANIAPNAQAGVAMSNLGINTANSSLASLGYSLGGSNNSNFDWLSKLFGTGGG